MHNDTAISIHSEASIFGKRSTLSAVLADLPEHMHEGFREVLMSSGMASLPPRPGTEPGSEWVELLDDDAPATSAGFLAGQHVTVCGPSGAYEGIVVEAERFNYATVRRNEDGRERSEYAQHITLRG